MYLSRIEMTGFKSFADKTVIEFDEGMTAVVGPNGSGKSNLSEAIRWVLGEQSAKSLRGNRMEDVIFNGTQQRKPVNIAKVTLVLNNEDRYLDYDYSEISISRSYNRNGDSNYAINNESVRLKDIVDLLLDSGLGKNSFSIISQGQVEQIFLNKPEERRVIIEEAAGVQKYQYRKNEAGRKLSKSSDNLSRVKDIIYEIEQQLEPLAKQRDAALIYQEKKDTLKRLEVSLYTYQIEQYKHAWQKNEQELTELSNKAEQLQAEVTEINDMISKGKQDQDDLVENIDSQSDYYQQAVQTLEQLKAKEQMLQQEMTFNEQSQSSRDQSYEERRQAQVKNEEKLAKYEDNFDRLNAELSDYKNQIDELTAEKNLVSGNTGVTSEELRNQLIDWYQKEATAKNQYNQYQNQINQLQDEEHRLEKDSQRASEAFQQLEEENDEKLASLENVQAQFKQVKDQYTHKAVELQGIQEKREALRQQLFDQERIVQKAANQRKNLENMQANYVGYYAGVRAVMQHANQIPGIDGTIADLIEVEPAFQTAIDTALGGALQHIVVEDDRAAKAGVSYLKNNRAGRATFLPRTNIKPRQLADYLTKTAINQPGFVAIADEKVKTSQINRDIMSNKLATTIIADNIENAQNMARKLNFKVKIVTLDGEVLMPGGSITGGRNKQQSNSMLQRQNELQEAVQAFEDNQAKLVQLETQWEALQDSEATLNEQLTRLREQTNQVDLQYQQMQQTVESHTKELKAEKNRRIIFQDDLKQLKMDNDEAVRLMSEAQKLSRTAKESIDRINQELNQLSSSEEERTARLGELEQTLNDVSTKRAVKKVEFNQERERIQQIKDALTADAQFIAHYKENSEKHTADLTVLSEQLVSLQEQIKANDAEIEGLPGDLQAMRDKRQSLGKEVRQQEDKVSSLNDELQAAYKGQAKLEAQIEKYQAFVDNQLDYLSQEYQLSFEAASAEAEDIEDSQSTMKTVKTIKRNIEQLGPINLQSIEDYDNLNNRYELLREQQDDLLTAMDQLQSTMAEMDKEVIKRFGETFKAIDEKFQQTFKRLFLGGDAQLKMTDPTDLLTTGVDIIAQPPGKKKQNLALLSGGERALTAIALLFAILEVKPVPFVVLDEVEAALDDANVYRYGEYIQDFTEQTQFIVITHRKGTMEHADVLYGVTMERSGVSKLASVKLSEVATDLEEE